MEEENGLREDCILARRGSWPPTSCVHSSQKSGVWVELSLQGHYSYLSVVTFNLILLHINCSHTGGAGRDF